jgi:hypothetical protein
MSFSEHINIESKRSVYDSCDPAYLRELREAAGMDLAVLARTACLSVAQVRELETDDSDNLFYSDAIKRQAYKRLLMILGAEPPTVDVPAELRDANKVADAHLNTLDQIVAMSHQPAMNRSVSDVLGAGVAKLKKHKQVLGALLLLLVAVTLFVLNGFQTASNAVSSAPAASVAVEEPTKPAALVGASSPDISAPMASAPAPLASVSAVASATFAAPAPAPASASASASASAAAAAAAAAAASKVAGCGYVGDAMPELTAFIAQKEGRYVYVVSPTNAEICVVDGNKQATLLQMKAGENRSVYGVPPWQVSAPNLSKIQIFFQGGRVSVPDAATRVKLLEVPISR